MNTKKFKTARFINDIVTTVFVILSILLINFLIVTFADKRWDLTNNGEFSLSTTTLGLLEQVAERKQSIRVYYFVRDTRKPTERIKTNRVLDLLKEYHLQSGKMISTPKLIDPERNPGEVKRLDVREAGSVVFELPTLNLTEDDESDNDIIREVVKPYEIWNVSFINGQEATPQFIGEASFSRAVKNLFEGKRQTIYFLEGHGEIPPELADASGLRTFTRELKQNNFSVRTINLLTRKEIPQSADLLALVAPRQPLLKSEVSLLVDYIERGGRLLILAEFDTDLQIEPLTKTLGIEIGNNLVLDPVRSESGSQITLIPNYGDHPIVNSLKTSRKAIVLYAARSVERGFGNTQGITTANLLLSSPKGWGEADYQSQSKTKKSVRYDEGSGDLKGPVTLGLAVTRQQGDRETRAVVIGDVNFAQNATIRYGANKDFLLNSVKWLIDSQEDIGIAPRNPVFNLVTMTKRQIWTVMVICIFLIPGFLLSLGTYQWWQRRSL